jgi:hypothetical protein
MDNDLLVKKESNTLTSPPKGPENEFNPKFRLLPQSLIWGVQAGLWMGLFILLVNALGGEDNIALKFAKYLLLFGVLGWVLYRYRKVNRTKTYFQKGIALGAMTTFFSGLTFLLVDLVVSIANPDLSFTRFGYEVNSAFDFLTVTGGVFFEILVFGMISASIWLVYFNRRPQ